MLTHSRKAGHFQILLAGCLTHSDAVSTPFCWVQWPKDATSSFWITFVFHPKYFQNSLWLHFPPFKRTISWYSHHLEISPLTIFFFDASCSGLWEASFPWKDRSRQEVVVNGIEYTCKPTYAFNLLRFPILLSELCRNHWWSSAGARVVLHC